MENKIKQLIAQGENSQISIQENIQENIQDKSRNHKGLEKISGQVTGQVSGQVTGQVSDMAKSLERRIVKFCKTPKSLKEIVKKLGYVNRSHVKDNIINPLIKRGLIKPTELKLTSRKQKYITVINKN